MIFYDFLCFLRSFFPSTRKDTFGDTFGEIQVLNLECSDLRRSAWSCPGPTRKSLQPPLLRAENLEQFMAEKYVPIIKT